MNYDTRFIRVQAAKAEQYARKAERRKAKYARYNITRPDRPRGKVPLRDRDFIVWDGEGPRDTGYSLLGNSLGNEICYPHLRTRDCLNLFLETAQANPYGIHVSFGFGYDVSCILWELSWRHLAALHKYGRVWWRDYEIEHIPRKWFRISQGGVSVKIFDVQSFFATSLVSALEGWRVGPWQSADTGSVQSITQATDVPALKMLGTTPVPALTQMVLMSERNQVEIFKKLRAEFLWKDIEPIRQYMRLELKYTVLLMELLREAFLKADYLPKSWHGPGAIARMAFTRHGVYASLTACPAEVASAARFAFIAGRFEAVRAGHVKGKVFCADINSAYPYYCSQLPNLARGTWRRTRCYEPGRFGVYRIAYAASPDTRRIYPLPKRDRHGMISWPNRVTGWYWNPEAELVKDDPNAEFLDGWVFDEDNPRDRPFAFLLDYYRRRKELKAAGDPAEYTFKLIINSIYGQLAQRTGWNKKERTAPKTHQLEFAGWITSSCRAAVYKIARECGDDLISIDTDGVTSLRPFRDLKDSKELGQWELTQFDDAIWWQSGIYALKEGNKWTKAKTRGIPKGTYSPADLLTALTNGQPLQLTKNVFVSYGLALNGRRGENNTWKREPYEYVFGGGGKRSHVADSEKRPGLCARVCGSSGLHYLLLAPALPGDNTESAEHKLPWLATPDEMAGKDYLTNLMLFDSYDLDPEDEWSLSGTD